MNKADPSQSYDERTRRFWRSWDMKTDAEKMIDTAPGEIQIIIDALADYHDFMIERVEDMNGHRKTVWAYRLSRIKQIQKKLEKFIGYDRDMQLEICRRKQSAKRGDIGEDALVLMARKGNATAKAQERSEKK